MLLRRHRGALGGGGDALGLGHELWFGVVRLGTLAYQVKFGVEVVVLHLFNSLLYARDGRKDFDSLSAAAIHEDVGMAVGDGPADVHAFESAPVDEAFGADAFNIFEDAAYARLGVEPRAAEGSPLAGSRP